MPDTNRLTFVQLVRAQGVAPVSRAVGRSRRFIQRVLQGDRLVGRKLMVDLKRAFPEFSADADIDAELQRDEERPDAAA